MEQASKRMDIVRFLVSFTRQFGRPRHVQLATRNSRGSGTLTLSLSLESSAGKQSRSLAAVSRQSEAEEKDEKGED